MERKLQKKTKQIYFKYYLIILNLSCRVAKYIHYAISSTQQCLSRSLGHYRSVSKRGRYTLTQPLNSSPNVVICKYGIYIHIMKWRCGGITDKQSQAAWLINNSTHSPSCSVAAGCPGSQSGSVCRCWAWRQWSFYLFLAQLAAHMDGYLAAREATNMLIIYFFTNYFDKPIFSDKIIAINTEGIKANVVCLSPHLQGQIESLIRAAKL